MCVSSTKMGYFVDTIQETAMSSTFSLHIVDGAGREWMGPGVYEREVKAGKVVRRAPECMWSEVKAGKVVWSR